MWTAISQGKASHDKTKTAAWETTCRYKSCTVCLPVAAKAVDCDGLSLSAGLARSAIPANTSPWIIPNSGWESNSTKQSKPLGNCQIHVRNEKLQLLTKNFFWFSANLHTNPMQ